MWVGTTSTSASGVLTTAASAWGVTRPRRWWISTSTVAGATAAGRPRRPAPPPATSTTAPTSLPRALCREVKPAMLTLTRPTRALSPASSTSRSELPRAEPVTAAATNSTPAWARPPAPAVLRPDRRPPPPRRPGAGRPDSTRSPITTAAGGPQKSTK